MKKSKEHFETSWETSSSWYDKVVGAKGHYYHQHVIIPHVLRLLGKKSQGNLLDLACGQGILARYLLNGMHYLGIDASASLIRAAKKYPNPNHQFLVHDLSKPVNLPNKNFSHATCILSVQNLSDPLPLFQTAYTHLQPNASFIIVMNHPSFRIPRQSSWGIDTSKKLQYRRVDCYMSELKIPIQTHPGKSEISSQTWSFHHPLSYFTAKLKEVGFVLSDIEEWCSDKKSIGKTATMENRSRKEFPLFMTLVAKKI